MEEKFDRYRLLESALERLSVIHNTEKNITTGKNKLCFTVNGEDFELIKSVDKVTGNRKTILEGVTNTMKPVVLYQDDSDRFTDKDIVTVTVNLDRYFVNEKLLFPRKYAICNRYYYVKPLLAALGLDLDYLYGCAAIQKHYEDDAIILMFLAEKGAGEEKSGAIFIVKDSSIEIIRFVFGPGNTTVSIRNSPDAESYELEYAGSTPEMLKSSIEMLITDFSLLVPASGTITFKGDSDA